MKRILLLKANGTRLPDYIDDQLEAEGYTLTLPEGGLSLEGVEACQPDVLLMEVMGNQYTEHYQFCRSLKENQTTENIPILLLGTHQDASGNTKHYLLEGLHAGANDYLECPYDLPELVGKIQAALRLKTSLEKVHVMAKELNQLNEELHQRNIHIEKELYVARQLQQSLLPKPIPFPDDAEDAPIYSKLHYQNDKLRVSGIYLPCDSLGGDLYDVLKFDDNNVGVSITDVSGHGLPAGFITAIFKTSLYRMTQQTTDPAEVLFGINNELYDIVKSGDYVTSVYLRINLETMQLQCSGAGHPYPFYYQAATKQMHRLKENSTPLVWVRDMPYPKDVLTLEPGDKVFLFTDGVSELKNFADELYGEERIADLLTEAMDLGVPYITDHLIMALSNYTEGAALADDISMVLIEAL